MRSSLIRACVGLCALIVFSPGCAKNPAEGVERLALLPIENLSGDPGLDIVAAAVQHVLAAQISADPSVQAIPVTSLSNAYAARAGRAVHGYLTAREDNLRLAVTVEDLETHKVLATAEAADEVTSQLSVMDSIARRLAREVRPFSTKNVRALHLYTKGLQLGDISLLEQAIATDPDFGLTYGAAANLLLNRNDPKSAQVFIHRGLAHAESLLPSDRAQLRFLDAAMSADVHKRAEAAAELARTLPSDAGAAANAAQLATQARQYRSAVDWYGRALKLDPQNADLWNQLGYAEAYNGNLDGARSALLEYGKRTPNNPNGFDSLGDVHYLLGEFTGAEKFFLEAVRMDPNFLGGASLWKAAHARLMTGDIDGADTIVSKYFDLLQKRNEPLLEYWRVLWDYEAGRNSRALETVPTGAAAPLIHVQRAIWLVDRGELARARKEAQEAAASSPSPQNQALIAIFLTEPPTTAAGWKLRAAQAFPGTGKDPVERLATAYALVLGRHFEEAVPLLKEAVDSVVPPANGTLQFLLGWALVESGKAEEAAPYLATYPIPQPGVDVFASLSISTPRIFQLQAAVLEQQGKRAEAERKLEIFKKLKGDSPLALQPGRED
jgi:tetratricopeptide (TPR) repeat protein